FLVVEHAAKGALRIEVNAWDGGFLDAQTKPPRLYPQLQRHAPARLGDPQFLQGVAPVGFESTEGIGEIQAVTIVDFASDNRVNAPAIARRGRVLTKVAQIPAARNDVTVVDRFEKHRNAGWLVLAVAVHGDQHFVAVLPRIAKRGDEGS